MAWTDTVPANTTFVSAAQTSGPAFNLISPAAGGTGTITATIALLAPGASARFTVMVRVSPNTPSGATIVNTAGVTEVTTDPNLANNSQTVTTTVQNPVTPKPPGPAVVDLERFGVNSQPTVLVVWFNLPLQPAGAQNVANYQIEMLGGSDKGGSRKGPITRVRKAVYNPAAQTVTLHMAKRLNLTHRYQITIIGAVPGGLTGTDGTALVGAGNGTPGSNFVGLITRKTLAGGSKKAIPAGETSKAGATPLARAISASAVDKLAVSGRLTARTDAVKNHRRWVSLQRE